MNEEILLHMVQENGNILDTIRCRNKQMGEWQNAECCIGGKGVGEKDKRS